MQLPPSINMSQLFGYIHKFWQLSCKVGTTLLPHWGLWGLNISHDTLPWLGALFLYLFLPGTPLPVSSLSHSWMPLRGCSFCAFPPWQVTQHTAIISFPSPTGLLATCWQRAHTRLSWPYPTVDVQWVLVESRVHGLAQVFPSYKHLNHTVNVFETLNLYATFTTSFKHFELPTFLSCFVPLSLWCAGVWRKKRKEKGKVQALICRNLGKFLWCNYLPMI